MPSKPLRFLYSKYAGQAPVPAGNYAEQGGMNNINSLLTKTEQSLDNAITHGQLQRLGRDFTKLERINMLFAVRQDKHEGVSQAFSSSVGSASTNSRSCVSRKDRFVNSSPTRFRSKSQEFQSKYKLAASRSSPEHKLAALPQSNVEALPLLDNSTGLNLQLKSTQEDSGNDKENEKVMEITMQTRNSVRKSVLPAKGLASHYNLINTNNPKRTVSSNSSNSFRTVQLRHQDDHQHQQSQRNRLLIDKLPRCQTGSPVDDDRLDSVHYQYLLNDDFSSSSRSSIKSDSASTQFSARAHRPSTTRTNSTIHRMRETCSTDGATLPGASFKTISRHNSVNNKSPENQWPPRYAIIPSWPSYEDIHTLNSCGDHRNLLTQLYRKEGRWSRDRSNKMLYRNNNLSLRYPYQHQQVHVVPSHTSMECAMCNLYSHRPDPTACPPNSPMVNCCDHRDICGPHSRMSNGYSVKVNHGTPTSALTTNATPTSALSKQRTSATPLSREQSKLASIRRDSRNLSIGDSSSSLPSRSVTASQPNDKHNSKSMSKTVSFSAKSKPEMSFTWDTYNLTYIKANV